MPKKSRRINKTNKKIKKTAKHPKYPVYNPAKWNTNKNITKSHNCYSYALNLIYKKQTGLCKKIRNKTKKNNKCNLIFPQPGQYVGIIDESHPRSLTCEKVVNRMLLDNPNIKRVSKEQQLPPDYYRIALYSRHDASDYHYYRQDADGMWSHKNGYRKATNKDNKGRLIRDPETADRGNYTNLCGFFMVPISEELKQMSNITVKYKGWKKNDARIKSKKDALLVPLIKK